MNTNKYLMLIVTLAVSIMLVVGVLVPVIADNTGSGSGSQPAYTNVGDYYYKTPVAGETHTIKGVQDGTTVQILLDGVVLHTLTMGDEAWTVPVISYINDDSTWGNGHTYVAGYLYVPMPDDSDPTVLDNYIFSFNYDIAERYDYGSFDIDFTIEGDKLEKGGSLCTCNFYLSSSGEYTYAESPVIESDTEYLVNDAYGEFGFGTGSTPAYYRYSGFIGSGIGTDVSSVDVLLSEWHIYVVGDDYPEVDSLQYTLDSENVEQGIKLNKITVEMTWEDSQSTVTTYDVEKFIVPVQIGEDGGSSGSSMSPTLVAMLSVIPLIVVVGLIVGTIGYFIRRQ